MWKPVRSWQALQPPGPGKPIRTDKLGTARASARLSACADTYSYHIVDDSGCCIQPDKAGTRRDLLSTHLKPPEPQQGPPFLSKPPERASQWLLQLGSKEWSWTWVLHECLHVPLSAINNNSLMLLVVTVKSINATLIDAGCDVCRPLMKEVFKQIIIWKWCFGEKKQFPSSGVWTGEYSLKV